MRSQAALAAQMGRKKIDIKYIDDAKRRKITLSKRKTGLLKKAYELSILCGCEMGVIIFDSDQRMYTYGSRGFDKTVKKWQNTKAKPAANYTNDDFDEESGKFRARRGAGNYGGDEEEDDDDDDDDDDSEDAPPPAARKKIRTASTSSASNGRTPSAGRKRSGPALPSLSESKPARKHSNPRKAALQQGTFAMPTMPTTYAKPSSSGASAGESVRPVLTPSLAKAVGLAEPSSAFSSELPIGSADIRMDDGSRGTRTRKNYGDSTPVGLMASSGGPLMGGAQARPANSPFSAGFQSGGTTDGLSPWLMSAVSTISGESNAHSVPSNFSQQSSGLISLTPPGVAMSGPGWSVVPEGRGART